MFVYFGGGSAACRGSDGPASRVAMAALQNPEGPLPPPDAKPLNLTCSGAVTVINPEQSLYYMSAPENNYRKVCKNLSPLFPWPYHASPPSHRPLLLPRLYC